MDPALLSLAIVVAAACIIVLLEHRFPYDRGQRLLRDGFWTDLAMYTALQSYVMGLLIFAFARWLDSMTGFSRMGLISNWPIAAQIGASLVVHDFYIYWFHRWQHHNKYLWRLHEAHHSTNAVDWLSGVRSHALEILINQTIEFAPLILLGADPITIVAKGTIDAIWGMWIHSNIGLRLGPMKYVINGPEIHRWHHALDADVQNRNYGTKFSFWDWMFGTAYVPEGRKPVGYGLGTAFPRDYFRQHLFAFRRFEEG